MRSKYFNELENLKNEIILYSSMVEKMIMDLKLSIEGKNIDLAELNISKEVDVIKYNRSIEQLCLKIISTQQPVAKDLRFISSTLNIIRNIEKIGNHVIEISQLLKFINMGILFSDDILNMISTDKNMLKCAIDAFIGDDLEESYMVISMDDKVDELFECIVNKIITSINEKEYDAKILIDILQIAKYLERIGDNSEMIADWIVFSITAKHRI